MLCIALLRPYQVRGPLLFPFNGCRIFLTIVITTFKEVLTKCIYIFKISLVMSFI